jgi:hypothetical protein
MCDCGKFSLEQVYLATMAMDTFVAKAAKVSEIAQIARGEVRLRKFLLKAWKELSEKAIKKAVKEIKGKTTQKKINAIVKKEMKQWSKLIKETLKKEITNTYKLSKVAGTKRANGKDVSLVYGNKEVRAVLKAETEDVTFTLQDEKAIKALLEHQLFWVDDFYDEVISAAIATAVRETMIELGYGSAQAGVVLGERLTEALGFLETPAGYSGSLEDYLESLAASTVTTARAHGVLRSFSEVGVTHYTITNPMDKRTCEVCAHMNGKVFTVEQGVNQMEAVLAAEDKDAVKKAHPWLSFKELNKISSSAGKLSGKSAISDSQALASAGQALPPFHFKCRCSIDISEESTHFE